MIQWENTKCPLHATRVNDPGQHVLIQSSIKGLKKGFSINQTMWA